MKINNKILGAILGVSTLLISSCDDGDKVIDTVFDETTRGAVLRTIEADGIFDLLSPKDHHLRNLALQM